jgi:lysophospholipase L1-like esterase
MMKKRIIYSLIVALIVFGLLALPEIASRVYYRAVYGVWPISLYAAAEKGRNQSTALFVEHSILPFLLHPGASVKFMDTSVKVNTDGYRGDELRSDAPLKILALGGSTTFDTGVDANDSTWCQQLETSLSAKYAGIQVINGGLPVYGLGANTIKYMLYDHAIRPDVVLIYQGFNDASPWWNKPLAEIRRTDYWMYRGLASRKWAGLQGEIMYTPEPPVSLLSHSIFLFAAFNKLGENNNIFRNMDFAKRVEEVIPEHITRENVNMLGYLISCIEKDGAIPILVPQSIGMKERGKDIGVNREVMNQSLSALNKMYIEYCKTHKVRVIDITNHVNQWNDDYFKDGVHFNNKGSREFALLLSKELVKEPYLARVVRNESRPERGR